MSGVADHLSNRMNEWLERVEKAGTDPKVLLQGLALQEIAAASAAFKGRNGTSKQVLERVATKVGHIPASATHPSHVGEYLSQALEVARTENSDPDDAFFTVLEALVVAQKQGADGSSLFNWAVTNLETFEESAGLAEEAMRGAMRLGRWPVVFCASVARTGWETEPDEDEVEVGAFAAIEEFARRGGEKWISLKELTERLAGVSWWSLKSDFRRLRISIEVKASQLRLEVYEGEVPSKAEKGRTSGSLDGTVVRGRFGGKDESVGTIEKGTAKLRVPERVDATAFELRVNRGGDQWVEIYGTEATGA
jgi:hypothetical protein